MQLFARLYDSVLPAVFAAILTASSAVAAEPEQVLPSAENVRAAFLKLLDRPRVPADLQIRNPENLAEGLVAEHLSIASEKKENGSIERVPMLLVRPDKPLKRMPAVIVLHGTGGNKDSMRPILVEFAKRGIVGVALDARYHGDRVGGKSGSREYVAAITRAWRTPSGQPQEHPFYYDTCWDIWRAIDYLQSRADIDGERLGMIGFSMGGIETWLAASVDERVKVSVLSISVQSFRWSLDNGAWQARANTIAETHRAAAQDLGEPTVNARVCRELWNKVVPGILEQFDCPSMIRLFAGRPLLVINGELDPNCPLDGAKIAFAAAESAYKEVNAVEKLRIDVAAKTAHRVTDEHLQMAMNWFVTWLKP
ncbi:MAG: alpha/beta hydrolase family protein [Planctomycetaceae bacterium]